MEFILTFTIQNSLKTTWHTHTLLIVKQIRY